MVASTSHTRDKVWGHPSLSHGAPFLSFFNRSHPTLYHDSEMFLTWARHRIVNYAVLPELYPRVDDLFIALLRAVGGTMSSRLTGLISEVIDGSLTLTAKTMSTNRNKHSFFFCVFFSCYGSLRCNPIQLWGVRAGGNLAFLPGWSLERRLCY